MMQPPDEDEERLFKTMRGKNDEENKKTEEDAGEMFYNHLINKNKIENDRTIL